MSMCPESESRAAMTDQQFWDHVLVGLVAQINAERDGPDDDLATNQTAPCPECGELGSCGYDAEGRPMVHITTEDHTA